MEEHLVKISKYLSYILRHKPEEIGLELDQNGWADVTRLIELTTAHKLTTDLLSVVVQTNDKQRFALSEDGRKIRASQGHSVQVDLQLAAVQPPATLWHGTAQRFWENIKVQGLQKQNRHHVHLTESLAVATQVGKRYGKLVMLEIQSGKMYRAEHRFYKSANNVWLVEQVPPEFITQLVA